jgi:hypothetical protein
MLVTLAGIVMLVKLDIRKALSGIVVNCEPEANDTLVRPVILWNAAVPMLVTVLGIVTLETPVVPLNAPEPMLVTPSGIVMLVRPVAPEKASQPMLVTLLGIVTIVMPS